MKAKVTRSESEVFEVKFTKEDLVRLARERIHSENLGTSIYTDRVSIDYNGDREVEPPRNGTVLVTVTLEKVVNPKEEPL